MVTTIQEKSTLSYLDLGKLQNFDVAQFRANRPFPWSNLKGFLTDSGFKVLCDSFPSLDLFEEHSGIRRNNNQRPHNRYYLAYETSIYHAAAQDSSQNAKGVVRSSDLPMPWQRFIQELTTSEDYRKFITAAFDVSEYRIRFAWHVGFSGCEVSPHVDSPDKIGTHILYFNTSADWDDEWGGNTLVLDGKQTDVKNPEYEDFNSARSIRITDNHSFLFKNAPGAWHGVKPLTCPAGAYRRLFNIIFEFPPTDRVPATTDRLKAMIPPLFRTSLKRILK
ncbi:MAG: 2OG-Fe(II) oxygenase [Cyanobacteria bacterium J06623_4]